jgi:hypothetical protein
MGLAEFILISSEGLYDERKNERGGGRDEKGEGRTEEGGGK